MHTLRQVKTFDKNENCQRQTVLLKWVLCSKNKHPLLCATA